MVAQVKAQSPQWSWSSLVPSFFVGFLVCSSMVRITPVDPAFAFLLGGAAAGLAAPGKLQAAAMAALAQVATVGVTLIAVGQQEGVVTGPFTLSLLAAVAGATIAWFAGHSIPKRWIAWGLLAVLMLVFVVQALSVVVPITRGMATEPTDEQYRVDSALFLKVFHLQERGIPFHEAYGDAFTADARFDRPTADLAGWRSPTTSTLWSLLFSDSGQIAYGFLILASAAIVAAYFLAAHVSDDVSALVAPALMVPYYLDALRLVWFTEYEFWATFLALGAAVLVVTRKLWPALGLAVLAGAMREWLISSTMAPAMDLLLRRKWKDAIPWILGTLVVVFVYVVNMYYVRHYLETAGIPPSIGAAGRVGGGGPSFILYTLRFCSGLLAHPLVVPYVAFVLALVGAARRVIARDHYLPLLFVLPLCAFMVFGSGQAPLGPRGWNDYYSAAFWPFALVLVPAAWSGVLRPRA